MKLLDWLLGRRKPPETMELPKNVLVSTTAEGKLYQKIAGGHCPECGSTKGFLEGPSGGLSTNIFCANEACGAGFNITPVVGIAEKIRNRQK